MRPDFNELRRLFIAQITGSTPHEPPEQAADVHRILDIIDAMSPEERCDIDLLLDRATRERIAREAKASLADVNAFIAQGQSLANLLDRLRRNREKE